MATKRPGVEEQGIDQQWRLEKEKELVLTRACKCRLVATRNGQMLVVYEDGRLEVCGVNGSLERKLQGVGVCGVAVLHDGRFLVLDFDRYISLYSQTWKKIKATEFEWVDEEGGMDVDGCDHMYIGFTENKAVRVFTLEGGAPVREIPCPGYGPSTICTMNHSEMLVLSNHRSVRVVDREGKVMYDVNNKGFNARVAVLQDDNILIGWWIPGRVHVDLYTKQLKLVRRVLADYRVELFVYAIGEFSTGEIALCDRSKLHIFRQTLSLV